VPYLSPEQLKAKAGKTNRVRDYLDSSHPLHGTEYPTTVEKPEPTIGGK
jgi:hypothetical protein